MRGLCSLSFCALLAVHGCGGNSPNAATKSEPPAKVENRGLTESDLATIRLTPEAERRLGIETVAAERRSGPVTRTFAGEVMPPPGKTIAVAAPMAGILSAPESGLPVPGSAVSSGAALFRLAPFAGLQRDLQAGAEAELRVAAARVEAARLRVARAEKMLRDQVGSVRALETAEEELKVAEAAQAAAEARLRQIRQAPLEADVAVPITAPAPGILRQIFAAPGQAVSAGAPLAEIVNLDTVWIRVPVYAGEVSELDRNAPVHVGAINAAPGSPLLTAGPVAAPPSADPAAVTADLYFQAANRNARLRPGERVSVAVALRARQQGLAVPWAAILHDIHGGAWVYENTAPQTFARRRVEVRRVAGGWAFLEHGPPPGTRVVTAGAAELFGAEFGPGK